ncbi:hypothetical protein RFI_30637 [Reticulomyxa filosa]|uniref:Peptidase S9 prolyl oligopeptidase catalytic domain-containing protein n=1 Tax=Reticulomyxa filosa TaxID=46433 RepID=X6LYQ2_RETFI|nr:hypothetical protein RFI_30637 [Reticulomyxa filosa]|eukprot:ETO06754.1 hypothetical protein RFI_30637 [Reticulomyxa filosa]
MGASMGGAVAIMAAKHYKERIQAIVCDCSFYSLREIIGYRLSKWNFFPVALIPSCLYVMNLMNEFVYGYSVDDISPIRVITDKDFDIPMLFVHSSNDSVVPMKHSECMYDQCKSAKKDLWIIDGIDHCGGFFYQPKVFVTKITNWVDNVLEEEKGHQNHNKSSSSSSSSTLPSQSQQTSSPIQSNDTPTPIPEDNTSNNNSNLFSLIGIKKKQKEIV